MEKCFYVYKIICLCGEWKDKYYIGSHYGYTDDNYTGSGKKIKEYFKLYGKNETYTKEVVEICKDKDEVENLERMLIKNNIDNINCINIRIQSGRGMLGKTFSHSDEIKEKMRKKIFTEEHRKRLSEAHKGKPLSEEHRKHISDCQKGISKGPFSEERKKRLSEAKKGKKLTEEHRRKVSEGTKKFWEKRKAAQKAA